MKLLTIFCPSILDNYKVGNATYHIICKKLESSPVQLCISNGAVVAWEVVESQSLQEWEVLETY